MQENHFELAASVSQSTYEKEFYGHLGKLSAFEFSRQDGRLGNFKFDMRKYISLGQAAFEEGPVQAPRPNITINWDLIDDKVITFRTTIENALSSEDDYLERFIGFSTRCYESWMTYGAMYPEAVSNPWTQTINIMKRGRLLFVTDQVEELLNHTISLTEHFQPSSVGNVGIAVKGKPKRLSGFVIDNRFEVQAKVLAYLRTEAIGQTNRKSLREIKDYLDSIGIQWSKEDIQVKATTPLKKTGVVGSNAKGFFVIQNLDDLVASYCFHVTKDSSINAILKRYAERASEFGDQIDLDDRCGPGETLNRIV